jgi:hypothetical protein
MDLDLARDAVHRKKAAMALSKVPVTAPESLRETARRLRDALQGPCTTRADVDTLLETYEDLPDSFIPEYDEFAKSLAPLRAYVNNMANLRPRLD